MKKTTYIVRHVWSKGIGSEKRAQPFGSIKYPGQMPWYPGKALEDWPQHKCEQGGQRDSSSWPRHWIATSFFESRTRCRWVYPRQYDQIFRRISSGSKTKRFECCCEQTNCFFDVRFSVSYWICTKRVSLIGLGMLKARLRFNGRGFGVFAFWLLRIALGMLASGTKKNAVLIIFSMKSILLDAFQENINWHARDCRLSLVYMGWLRRLVGFL